MNIHKLGSFIFFNIKTKKKQCYLDVNKNKLTKLAEYNAIPLKDFGTKAPPQYTKKDILVVNVSHRTLRLYFNYNQTITGKLKKIPICSWNPVRRCWEIPFSEKYLAEIKRIASQHELQFFYHEENKQKLQPRKSKKENQDYRKCPQSYIDKLKELRYSKNTIKVYTDLFGEFINYYEEVEIRNISESMIVDFLQYLVNERNASFIRPVCASVS